MAQLPLESQALKEFQVLLESPEVCRTNFQGTKFYHFDPIKQWLSRKENGVPNAANLIRAVDRSNFVPTSKEVLTNPVLFAILVEMGCGHMFQSFSILQSNLDIPDLSHQYETILSELKTDRTRFPKKYQDTRYDGVIKDFDEKRWDYLPLALQRHGVTLCNEKTILPFFYMEEIGQGGTAVVYHCKIQQDLVESDLARELEPFRQTDDKYGNYFEFAVKSYMKEYDSVYKMESNAFKGLRKQTNLGVVKHLGEYRSTTGPYRRHILLELGEKDLEEYMFTKLPPVLTEEIHTFWDAIFQVAFTLSKIHRLNHEDEGGNKHVFQGWHGDIKPDNILRVHGQFKLADFGFSKFEKHRDRTQLFGGTRSFGAPERDQIFNDKGATATHSQTIDTWSLGCVFSVVATWVILGCNFYEAYRHIRQEAIKALPGRSSQFSQRHSPYCDDAFHDGEKVLTAVTDWHRHLRNSARTSDTISCLVLDLVDNHMLISNPDERLSSADLTIKLDAILTCAKQKYQTKLADGELQLESEGVKQGLWKFDKAAPQLAQSLSQEQVNGARPDSMAPGPSGSLRLSLLNASRMTRAARKSEAFSRVVYGKTANREQILKPSLLIPVDRSPHNLIHPVGISPKPERNGKEVDRSSNLAELYSPNDVRLPSEPELEREVVDQRSNNASELPTTPERQLGSPISILPFSRVNSRIDQTAVDEEYRRLSDLWDKRTLWSVLRKKTPKDPLLKQFIMNRDIIFVVDNDPTMLEHWDKVTRTLLTLAMKIGPLDEDGLDLRYSCGNHKGLSNVEGYEVRSKFSQSMDEVKAKIHPEIRTDMCKTLSRLFDAYIRGPCVKQQTLIILTNGKWEGSHLKRDVEDLIIDFVNEIKNKLKRMEKRWYSIQFISFGDYEPGLSRMKALDDELKAKEDIVDHKSWDHSNVRNLILGSMTQDGDEDEETPVTSPLSSSMSPEPVPTPALTPTRTTSRISRLSSMFK